SAAPARRWISCWRGPGGEPRLYDAAVEKCFAVMAELEGNDAAQDAFRRFARLLGILSPDMMPRLAGPARTYAART
ncbi:MAG: DUF982 domain-containing protein, partial [Bauldia sp.]